MTFKHVILSIAFYVVLSAVVRPFTEDSALYTAQKKACGDETNRLRGNTDSLPTQCKKFYGIK